MNASQRALIVGLIGLGVCGLFALSWVLAVRGGERPVRDQYSPLYLRTLRDATANWQSNAGRDAAPVSPQGPVCPKCGKVHGAPAVPGTTPQDHQGHDHAQPAGAAGQVCPKCGQVHAAPGAAGTTPQDHQGHDHAQPAGAVDYDTALAQGRAAFAKKEFAVALQWFAAAGATKPTAPLPWAHMGDCHLRLGRRDQAIASYRKCTSVSPKFLPGWYGLGVALRYAGQTQQALAAFQTVKQLSPNDSFADEQIKAILKESGAATRPAG